MTDDLTTSGFDSFALPEPAARPAAWKRALLGVALVGFVVWVAFTGWGRNLDQACWLNQWPPMERCEEVLGKTPAEQIQKLRERLARNPGDSQALVALATYTQLPGGIPGLDSAAVLAAAEKMAPQDGYVLRMQAQAAVEAKQWPGALDRLTRLAQFHNDADARRMLATMVAVSGQDAALKSALSAALVADGRWFDSAVRAMPGAKLPVASAMPLVGEALPLGLITPALSQVLMRQLKNEGMWLEAHAIWLQLWKKPLGFVFNSDFEQAFVADGFDWEVVDKDSYKGGARVSQVGRPERGQVLRVEFNGKALRNTAVVRQYLLLMPGRYRFTAEYQSSDLRSSKGLAWVFSCPSAGNKEVARTEPMNTTGRGWMRASQLVEVPADCGMGVALQLQTAAAFETKTGQRGEMLFDRFALVREEAATP